MDGYDSWKLMNALDYQNMICNPDEITDEDIYEHPNFDKNLKSNREQLISVLDDSFSFAFEYSDCTGEQKDLIDQLAEVITASEIRKDIEYELNQIAYDRDDSNDESDGYWDHLDSVRDSLLDR